MEFRRCLLTVTIVLSGLLASQNLFAHAEHDKARFVAVDGEDSGDCSSRVRPCKSIGYAILKANKGDSVLVAQGKYQLASAEALFQLSSTTVPVLGGYSRIDLYQTQDPDRHVTTLLAVPVSMSNALYQQGFTVIADSKDDVPEVIRRGQKFLQAQRSVQGQADCVNGSADIYPCSNVSLVSHLPLSAFDIDPSGANDIWGHHDLNNGREYALIGFRNGLAVVDISAPETPTVIDTIEGVVTGWRDIKVYQYYDTVDSIWRSYAYVSADGATEGMRVIELTHLPHQIRQVTTNTADLSAHNVYISNVDYSLNIPLAGQTPLLHSAGSNNAGGAFRTFSLETPSNPQLTLSRVGTNRTDYSHDLSSVVIDDERAGEDCQNAPNGCVVIIDFNEDQLRLWQHSDDDSVTNLSNQGYPNTAYTHSGWWSEDKRYVIVHDELDERNFGLNTTLNIFDISDLSAPALAGTWQGPTRAIDHNGFVRGNRYYMSNYERGLTVLDITSPAAPSIVGEFDTYPQSDLTAFNGAWGVYPFLPSGLLLVSDINSGLYVLRDETSATSADVLNLSASEVAVNESDDAVIQVIKSGDGAVTVGFETLPGSANAQDFTAQRGVLSWTATDTSARSITIPVTDDQLDNEVTESFFVRLFDPQNGATLTAPNLVTINILGNSNGGSIHFVDQDITAQENAGSVSVAVNRIGDASAAASINLTLVGDTANQAEVTTPLLNWDAGEDGVRLANVNLLDDDIAQGQRVLQLQLSNAQNAQIGSDSTIDITVSDDDSNLAPTVDAGADRQVNTRQNTSLIAAATDPDGSIVSFAWRQIEGESVTLSSIDTPNTSFTAPDSAGTLVFEIEVADNFGVLAQDQITVTVVEPAPVAQTPTPAPAPSSGGGGGSWSFGLILLALAVALRRAQKLASRH